MSALQKLHPLQFNENTQEPFLRLPAPNDNIIITVPRPSDASALPPILNDPRVYATLASPPYPYSLEDGVAFLTRSKEVSNKLLAEIWSKDMHEAINGCPVTVLKEIQEDGSEKFLGCIDIHRCRWFEVLDPELKCKMTEENEARAAGDPDLVWEFGDYLAASHHGRGIMSAAVGTLLEKWAIPRMQVQRMHVTAFKGNPASVRVFEKNGFVWKGVVDDCLEMQESKGGGRTGLHVLDWSLAKVAEAGRDK